MDYLDKYIDLMEQALSRGWTKKSAPVYTEGHHIFPKSWMPNDYVVRLTAQEHYEAHWLLYKSFPEDKAMTYALWGMYNGNQSYRTDENIKISAERYAEARIAFAEKQRSSMMGSDNPNSGRDYSDKEREVLRVRALKQVADGTCNLAGANNPNFQRPPWKSHRATDLTREIWSRADEMVIWINDNPQKRSSAMTTQFGYTYYSVKVFENVYKKIKGGWIPLEDTDWLEFFNR